MRHYACSVALVAGLVVSFAARAAEHPRLFITPRDIPRMRHACGLGTPAADAPSSGRFGAASLDFNAVRACLAQRIGTAVLPGELSAAAFLHVVDPTDPADARRLEIINRALKQPLGLTTDTLELVLALDWCWDALDPVARREFLLSLRQRPDPLTPADSPLDQRVFRRKLATLAAAVAIDDVDEPSPAWAELRAQILDAARTYFQTTFATFVAWRGLAPTSPTCAAREESDAALAIELAGHVLEQDTWTSYRGSVGRWLEHYVLVRSSHPALQQHFMRDDGSQAPLTPAPRWDALLPLTAHLIATRTADTAAALIADGVAHDLRDPTGDVLAIAWRWVPIVFDVGGLTRCDPHNLPIARNLGGAVVFRSPPQEPETTVWIEAGQPHLRRRQHYDAGHFMIRSGGHLVVEAGDDVAMEAVPSKGGRQQLGATPEPFDFEQFFSATIAHNCMLLWETARVSRWYGRRYLPTGGQRLSEGTCTDFAAPLEATRHVTARQLAYGHEGSVAYLALDLTPAYESRAVTSYTREFVFLWGHSLLVIDRLRISRDRATPHWIINLPSRPEIDGHDLTPEARSAGSDNRAGVWHYPECAWVRWNERDGALWLKSLLPNPRGLRVVGGPATKLIVADGPYTGRAYVGGNADSFERLIIPASRHDPRNAWYRLGCPALLGNEFAKLPHWGRIEIEPLRQRQAHVFVTALFIDRAAASEQPTATIEQTEHALELNVACRGKAATIQLPLGTLWGGVVELQGETPVQWKLPTCVEADPPLPTRPVSDGS
ncbi:MAG: heparinase II/III family protein [Planctomycetes bacterium]|nr:heparinase II/III family protein [Planctomycetota bacterium]